MTELQLPPAAQKVIADYLHLPFPSVTVPCPYFNNRRSDLRGGLRALIGKGSVDDIIEEATILALKERVNLSTLTPELLTKFLVDHHIGIDCSGLAYYILNAELEAQGRGSLGKNLILPPLKNPLRKFMRKFRLVESVNTRTFADPKNSETIALENIQPGDMIIMLETGLQHDRDHLLIVHKVIMADWDDQSLPSKGRGRVGSAVHYTHSLQWRSDGKYNHGVKQGIIEITDVNKPLLSQLWIEHGKEGEENETYEHARLAKVVGIRRLRILG